MTPDEYLSAEHATCAHCRAPRPDVKPRVNLYAVEARSFDTTEAIESLCEDCARALYLDS
ncbi:MAG: hypothetical protein GY769_20195 [bacterium]|nr:hypothetical protein [bacterium]